MIRAVLIAVLVAGCGAETSATPTLEAIQDSTPAESPELNRARMAAAVEGALDEVDEAICDPTGEDQPEVAICYIGIAESSEAATERFLCDEVLPVIRTFTEEPVTLVGFNSADDQVTSAAPDC